ncbi:hypothetical protein ABPG72_003053 [Tetrahymena utriculariae]
MDERNTMLMNFVLNDNKHLRRFLETQTPFKTQKKGQKPAQKPIMKGQFLTFSKMIKQFRPFYFELYPNLLIKYQDKTKPPPVEQLQCQYCTIYEENEVIGEQVAFGIILQNVEENEIVKLVTDKFQMHKMWMKALKKFCKLQNFLQRYKVENRIFDHFYRCIDKKKRAYASVKIVNKKGLKPEQKRFVENEISILRRITCNLLPKLKKVYEDDNYIYLTFQYFQGDDLLKIVCTSSLEEIAVATLTYHILKGLRSIHSQNCFHGNLKLENIIFSTSQKENEIFIINFKYIEENSIEYRDRLIKRGQNNYVAPEVIEGKDFDSQIDIFSLGVCLFYMVFQKFPYAKIEKVGDKWTYDLDISILEQMFNEKKKDPSSHQHLSVSGIDFLLKLLQKDPDKRPTAAMALNHHWFINFTNKPTENKKLQKFRESHQMTSLKTILECSELSEKEIDSCSRILFRRPIASNLSTFTIGTTTGNIDDNNVNVSDEEDFVNQQMINLNNQTKPKIPSKNLRNNISERLQTNQLPPNFEEDQNAKTIEEILNQGRKNHNSPEKIDYNPLLNNLHFNEYLPSSPTLQSYKYKDAIGLDMIAEDTSEVKTNTNINYTSPTKKNSTADPCNVDFTTKTTNPNSANQYSTSTSPIFTLSNS